MRISKRVHIDRGVRWNSYIKRTLCRKNCYKGHAYIICTSPHEKLLFEIVEARWLSSWYDKETVLAVCATRKEAYQVIRRLVDILYNAKTLTYARLVE